jgi:PHD/YefM family antitoxin component YafN of YafNO toxin-antitoxin module
MSIPHATDKGENRVAILLNTKEYECMVEELEDNANARATDEVRAAIARGEDEFFPYESRPGK